MNLFADRWNAPEPTVDYALAAQAGCWLRHPVLGDPSFDSFERFGPQPIYRGEAPLEWPVNGSLFRDSASGDWFLFVGRYPSGYAIRPESPCKASVLRSSDRGQSWSWVGDVFGPEPFAFEGTTTPVSHAPDVTVIEADGKYWMAYDWCHATFSWSNAHFPTPEADSAGALAVSDKPAGPYRRLPQPIFANSNLNHRLTRFTRLYATTVLRRANDWLALLLADSGPHFAWAYTASTAPAPEGPWTFPRVVLSAEGPDFYPAPVEFHPAFTADGRVWAPATSVARSRSYQALFSADLEAADDRTAWRLDHDGGLWHPEPIESETHGIWGQTFHGFVHQRRLQVMFPSRDSRGFGTIATASAPWPLKARDGFTLASGAALLKVGYERCTADLDLEFRGHVLVLQGFDGSVGPETVSSDALPLLRGYQAAAPIVLESESLVRRRLRLNLTCSGRVFGFYCLPGTWLRVHRCAVTGQPGPVDMHWTAVEGLLNAGQNERDHWRWLKLPEARFGQLAVCEHPWGRLKWSFDGSGYEVWLPRGPEWGAVSASVDGQPATRIEVHAATAEASSPLLAANLPAGRHALVLTALEGPLIGDSLTVRHRPPE